MTTPAPKRGLVSDEPTGLRSWQVRPVGLCGRSIVRTSFSVPSGLRFCPPSRGSRSRRAASWSESRSCRSASQSRILSTAISTALCGAVATAGANRGRNTGGSEGLPLDPTGGSAAAVCPPAHRQRVCCKAQSRRIDCCSPSTAAVVGAGWVLSISCTCAKVTPESEQTASRASELEVWR